MNIEVGKVYSIRLTSGEEVVAKIKAEDESGFIVESMLAILPTKTGLQFVPPMFSNELEGEMFIRRSLIGLMSSTREDVEIAYVESVTGIRVPSKQIILG
jgi:hypothetical protein